jgi:glycosyltransferase involved in cell wall biosynthesis
LLRARPEVAYIWQDGAVLMAALAALIANVPRIVISLRGMPPNLRPNLAKDEFRDMYQTLLSLPGVSFTTNNRPSAEAYCEWLGFAPQTFTIIPNAAEPANAGATADDATRWQEFAQRTNEAELTLGGVFRFEPNKRPKLWIEFAARVLEADPRFRFVLVGEGSEFSACREYARELGLNNRILFVGHSHNVGFWLSKMDVLSLLSEHEGLPNVLIEAQISGVPVLSTPAGGASETFEPGLTGLLLDSASYPSGSDYVNKLLVMTGNRDCLRRMSAAASTRADEMFAIERVLAHTVAHFKGQRLALETPHNRLPDRLEKIA